MYLKFFRNEKENKLVGFVRKRNGSWEGCRESEEGKKKIVVLGVQTSNIIEGVLYRANLIPMRSDQGFVCIKTRPVQFEAKMETLFHKNGDYYVRIKFGNKQMTYDIKNKNPESSQLSRFVERLSHRTDIKDINKLVDDFIQVVSAHSYGTEK